MGCLTAAYVSLAAIVLAHPFYVTICQIDHNPDTRSLEVTFRFFTDDLERALDSHAETHLYLGTDRELAETDRHLLDYLASRVRLEVDGEPVELRFVGKEVEPDVSWCYVEVLDVVAPSRLTMTNRILLEHFETQTNIVHATVDGEQRSLLLRAGAAVGTLEF